jgi:hypothetical protein
VWDGKLFHLFFCNVTLAHLTAAPSRPMQWQPCRAPCASLCTVPTIYRSRGCTLTRTACFPLARARSVPSVHHAGPPLAPLPHSLMVAFLHQCPPTHLCTGLGRDGADGRHRRRQPAHRRQGLEPVAGASTLHRLCQQHRFLATGSVNLHACIDGAPHEVTMLPHPSPSPANSNPSRTSPITPPTANSTPRT